MRILLYKTRYADEMQAAFLFYKFSSLIKIMVDVNLRRQLRNMHELDGSKKKSYYRWTTIFNDET